MIAKNRAGADQSQKQGGSSGSATWVVRAQALGHLVREQDQKWNGQDMNQHPDGVEVTEVAALPTIPPSKPLRLALNPSCANFKN